MSEDFFGFDFEESGHGHCVKHTETGKFLQADGTLGDTKISFSDIKVFPGISMILQAEGERGAVNVGDTGIHFIPHQNVDNWIKTCKQRLEKGMSS